MPIDMVALSRSIPEIVAAMVTQMLVKMINQGIAKVTGIENAAPTIILKSSGSSSSSSDTTTWGRYGAGRYGSEGEE